ncbi:hypothetical protein [Actinoplanes sp. NPDC049316]|uniref:hypothetical protein n=1 Tax=Actinoplanes sp. NPDC049316 TaxID=3154727 RepID=UPI00342404B3
MDVRGVLRRTRLSLVASLFLTALLGGPVAAAPVAEPLAAPAPATIVTPVAVTPSADLVAAGPVHHRPATTPAPGTAVDLPLAAPVLAALAVRPRTTRLTSQVRAAVAGPRAPPATA